MKPVKNITIHSVNDIHEYFGIPDELQHPLITLIDYSQLNKEKLVFDKHMVHMNLYCIIESEKCVNSLMYGQTTMDYTNGTLVFYSPGQHMVIDAADYRKDGKTGWGLYFHPDFLRQSFLSNRIKDYTYFDYQLSEALHLSAKERTILKELTLKIKEELANNIDKHSKDLVVATLELILKYCERFYDRQFITRSQSGNKVVGDFKTYIKDYINTKSMYKEGGLSVQKIANNLNLSPNYLSDLLKKETGKNATELIHLMMVDKAKSQLLNTNDTIQEIAYSLGFEYSQSFSKMFKNMTGYTPSSYRSMN
jgi:AraC-like DNA-binding protein